MAGNLLLRGSQRPCLLADGKSAHHTWVFGEDIILPRLNFRVAALCAGAGFGAIRSAELSGGGGGVHCPRGQLQSSLQKARPVFIGMCVNFLGGGLLWEGMRVLESFCSPGWVPLGAQLFGCVCEREQRW